MNYLDQRFASFIAFGLCVIMIAVTTGCIAGSSRNINAAGISGRTPGQVTPEDAGTPTFDRSKDSYRIYSVILNHKWNNGNIVVRDRTNRGLLQNDKWLETNVGKSYPEAASDFKNVNDTNVDIENRFD